MSIWISWVEVEGVLDILLFCTIDLTFFPNLFRVFRMMSTDSSFFFSSTEVEVADVSELAGKIMATAASLQPTAFHTGAPGFYTEVKRPAGHESKSGYCF